MKVKINTNIHPLVFNNFHEAKEYLLNYWKTIDLIKESSEPPELVVQILYQDVRSKIIDILREGIINNSHSSEFQQNRRYAINAQEIKLKLKEKLETQIKLSTIYFHLQKLQEHGYVQIVAIIKEGRHNIAYYGRTAQLFLFRSKQPSDEFWDSVTQIICNLTATSHEEVIRTLIENYKQSEFKTHIFIRDWIRKNVDTISKTSIDIRDLVDFLCNLYWSKQGAKLANIVFTNK